MENENQEFKTANIYLAAFLHACKQPVQLLRTEPEGGESRRINFVFGVSEEAVKEEDDLFKKLEIGFINGTVEVSAGNYARSIKDLKVLCFSGDVGGGRREKKSYSHSG